LLRSHLESPDGMTPGFRYFPAAGNTTAGELASITPPHRMMEND
jgi:hypothetical protein